MIGNGDSKELSIEGGTKMRDSIEENVIFF